MRKFNQDAPGVKLRGRPKKESSDKRDRKVSVNFTDAEGHEVKAKAAAAGVSIAELRISGFFRLARGGINCSPPTHTATTAHPSTETRVERVGR